MSKIFVGGLALSVSNDDLGGHFSRYGTVTDVVAMKQRGFGFVEFAEVSAAQAALDDGPHVLHGKEVSVRVAATREAMADVRGPSHLQGVLKGQGGSGGSQGSLPHKLFVGGLPKHLDTRQLEEYFSTYGSLSDAVVMGDRGFGFVAFHDREAMERVLDQDHFFDGQPFSVKQADGQRPTRPAADGGCGSRAGAGGCGGYGKGGGPWGSGLGVKKIFVGGIPKDMQTPELREFFSWFGQLADAVAMDGRGFGFVEFVDQAGADNLMRQAGDIVIRGFKCSLRLADGKGGSGPGKGKGGGSGGYGWGSPY